MSSRASYLDVGLESPSASADPADPVDPADPAVPAPAAPAVPAVPAVPEAAAFDGAEADVVANVAVAEDVVGAAAVMWAVVDLERAAALVL